MYSTFFILKKGDDTMKAHQSENVHLLIINYVKILTCTDLSCI